MSQVRVRAAAPWIAALIVTAGGGVLGLGLRAAARLSSARPDPSVLTPLLRGDLPVLVLAADPGCGACERALADTTGLRELRAAGVRLEIVLRGSGGRADTLFRALGPGPVPAYLLAGADGRPLALHRGAVPARAIVAWVRSTLTEPADTPFFP